MDESSSVCNLVALCSANKPLPVSHVNEIKSLAAAVPLSSSKE